MEKDGVPNSKNVLTTYTAHETAIFDGMDQVCKMAAVEPSKIDQFIHETKTDTDTLMERHRAKAALITTECSHDVIELRTKARFEQ